MFYRVFFYICLTSFLLPDDISKTEESRVFQKRRTNSIKWYDQTGLSRFYR